MILFKKFFHYVVLFSAFSFVPFVFADDFDITQYVSQNDIHDAAQALTDTLKANKFEFAYLTLDSLDGFQGNISFSKNYITHINITSVEINFAGIALYRTYKPIISMEADVGSDCTISNEHYTLQRTNPALDKNFKTDIDMFGKTMFTSLTNKIISTHPELSNHCLSANNIDLATVASPQDIQTATQAFADELKKSHLNLDNMVIEKMNGYTGFATIENNILNHIRISSFKLDLSGFPLYNLYSPTIDIDADIAPDCSVSKHIFIVEESNPGLDNFFHMNLYNHGYTLIKTLIQSSLLKNYCSANLISPQ